MFLWLSYSDEICKKKKVKHTALDFTVHTGGADLHFLALQPGSVMGIMYYTLIGHLVPFVGSQSYA